MINDISENKLMESFYTMIPHFKHFFKGDLVCTICNNKQFLVVEHIGHLKTNYKVGDLVPQGSAADLCMKKGEVIHTVIPEEVFGVPVESIGIPVMNGHTIEGALVLNMSVHQLELKEKVASLANILSKSLTQMNANVSEMAERFQKISDTNSSIGDFIEQTKDHSKKTDEVLTFIQGIAKQTNLLGLNAAIESARAGEYGKGFGVVSSEIRNLSKSTKESINQINETLNNIQSSINEIYDRFEQSNDLLSNQTAGLQEITATIQELTDVASVLDDFAKKINN